MTLNYPAPYQLDIRYTTTPTGFQTMEHHLTIGVNVTLINEVGADFSDIEVTNRNNTVGTLDLVVDALIAGMVSFYPAATDFIDATLYEYGEESYEGLWQAVYEIGEVGEAGTTANAAHQDTITLRTSEGGICRFQMMETSRTELTKAGFPTAASTINALKDLLISLTMPFIGQDGGFLVAGNYWSATENERLYRKRYRT